jgi:hypothetical protein
MHGHPHLFHESRSRGTPVGEARQGQETARLQDTMGFLEQELDILDGQQIQDIGRHETIERVIGQLELHVTFGAQDIDTIRESLETPSRELDHGGAHIHRHVARRARQMPVQQSLRQPTGPATELENRVRSTEPCMLDQDL